MSTYRNVSDRLPPEGAKIRTDDTGRVNVWVHLSDASQHELVRVAQHLLEAAGASTSAAVTAVNDALKEEQS